MTAPWTRILVLLAAFLLHGPALAQDAPAVSGQGATDSSSQREKAPLPAPAPAAPAAAPSPASPTPAAPAPTPAAPAPTPAAPTPTPAAPTPTPAAPAPAPAAPAPAAPEPVFKSPPASPGVAEAVKDFVSVSNGLITIRAKNGKLIEFADQLSEENPASDMAHCVKDYLPEHNLLLVDITYYEEGGFVAVSLENGETTRYHGEYRFPPGRSRLLHINCGMSETYFVQILRPTPCGLVQEFILQTAKALGQTVFAWKDDQAIEMTYSPDTPHEHSGKSMGVIQKGQDFWRIEWTELAHELMGWKANPETPQDN